MITEQPLGAAVESGRTRPAPSGSRPYAGVRVTVLGASGFIGRWVAAALHAQGADLVLVVRDASSARTVLSQFGILGEFVEVDLANLSAVPALLPQLGSAITFNLAGYGVDHSEQDEHVAFRINSDLVRVICEALVGTADPRWPGQQLIHVGSALEYGRISGDLDEAAVPHPTTVYGRSKLAGSEEVVRYCQTRGLKAAVARLFTVYGPGEYPARLLPSLMAAARNGHALPLSVGEQRRDFTYVEDVADGLLRLGFAPLQPGEIVNIATGRLTGVRTFAETAAQILGIQPERLQFGAIPPRIVEMEHADVKLERLRRITGWTPGTIIQEGVHRTLQFEEQLAGLATVVSAEAQSVHHLRTSCRACDSDRLRAFLSLGPTPLANSFLHSPAEFADERVYPLDMYFCEECSLVQLLDVIDPEFLFRDYIYVTGTSETIAEHNRAYARSMVERLNLSESDLVVEVASNDGSLLSCFKKYGVRTLGVEPARNVAAMARDAGIATVTEFFNRSLARSLRDQYGRARIVAANNVLAHVDETREFLHACADLVDADGLVVFEVPYLRDLLNRLEYDTVYHEHLCYFSVTSLMRLCDAVGLKIVAVDHVPVHGGTIRVSAQLTERPGARAAQAIEMADAERLDGLTTLETFSRFGADVRASRTALRELLTRLRAEGKIVAAYGAPAKGNTLLNYCAIDTDLVQYTVDRNPLKVGTYTPGMHLPVLPAETVLERKPDYLLILAWNFANEIIRQQQAYQESGGRFIIPLPRPTII